MLEAKYWHSTVGAFDDFDDNIDDTFIDGATIYGPWAIMSPTSHTRYGRGLGVGRGQKYKKQPSGRWLKVAG